MRKDVLLALAAALLFAGGCACVNEPRAPSAKPAPENRPSCLPKKAYSEVKSELVYDLGGGVVTNSTSVLMPGGYAAPRPVQRPGGVDICCNPVPQRYYDALAADQNRPVPVAAAPVVPAVPAVPGIPAVSSGGVNYCPTGPAVATAPKFAPGEGISELFTMTEEELQKGPQIFFPRSGQLEAKAVEPMPAKEEATAAKSAESIEEPAKAETASLPAKDEAPAPAEVEIAAALIAPPTLPADTVPAFPTDKYATPGTALGQTLPPVPTVADLDGAAEAMLSRDGANASSLPAVELPPKLN